MWSLREASYYDYGPEYKTFNISACYKTVISSEIRFHDLASTSGSHFVISGVKSDTHKALHKPLTGFLHQFNI